jgi:hypothetical protein
MELMRLTVADGSWNELKQQWAQQCAQFDEEFEQYAAASIPILEQLAAEEKPYAGVYGLRYDDGSFHAVLQANSAFIPNYDGRVLRVRHLLMSPRYDFGEYSIDDYSMTLGRTFARVVRLAITGLPSPHIKFHLRSPADRQFFGAMETVIEESGLFSEVAMRGAWLYLTQRKGATPSPQEDAQ